MIATNNKDGIQQHPASYRDAAGYVFMHNGEALRQVNQSFKKEYDLLMQTGAYKALVERQLLITHEEIGENLTGDAQWYKILRPAQIPFISYPYEWSFSMMKDAALLTLDLAITGISYNLILKDATPFNIQWTGSRPLFIDTLSFAVYDSNSPWVAYRQFCECFLSPLLLMHYTGKPLQQLQLAYPEGIPLAVTAKLLPWRSRFNINTFLHIHLHSRISQQSGGNTSAKATSFSKTKMQNLLQSLRRMVEKISLPETDSVWAGYYDEAATRQGYLDHKKQVIRSIISSSPDIKKVADLGANEGEFSMIAAAEGKEVLAADLDPFCIERLYHRLRKKQAGPVQPLVLDLSNPSPSNGFNGAERASFTDRCAADLVLALALIHHLVIGKNIPFDKLAAFFARLGRSLVIEFVPMDDPRASMLAVRKQVDYSYYTVELFRSAFEEYFSIENEYPINDSSRIVFVMERKT